MNTDKNIIFRQSIPFYLAIAISLMLLGFYYFDSLKLMTIWWEREEYSHGPLIPLLFLFFIWQSKDKIETVPFTASYIGVVILLLGLLIGLVGNLSTIYTVMQYAFLITLFGLVLSLVGRSAMKYFWVPLGILVFMIPLPNFLYFNLSQQLQLISSSIGVEVIRFFGVSVFLEGNVIDLGSYKLQVVDACSGLRYLFPLMSFGFICAYLFKAPMWQRVLIFLSTIPITVLMNSFRIGVIGVLVDRFGQEQAEGFLHDFEGWIIFMACVAILFAEMWVLNKLFSKEKRPLQAVFGLEFPEPTPKDAVIKPRPFPKSFIASLIILIIACIGSFFIDDREEIIPERSLLASFPTDLDGWHGKPDKLDSLYLNGLAGLSDHIIGDYVSSEGEAVNLYVAYYESQRAGGSVHSPKSCIPGGGWVIESIDQVPVDGIQKNGQPIQVNRVQIAKGDYKQLVYYWFDQRGRNITNEYLLKWYLFWDSLTRHRSDGSLIRLTTIIGPNESLDKGDARLQDFASDLGNTLSPYIPE